MRCLFVLPLLAVACLTAACIPARSSTAPESTKDDPLLELPSFKRYKVDPYLAAAVKLQALGKEKAVALLRDLAGKEDWPNENRTILLCRMLFAAKPGSQFRRPGIGAPVFIGEIDREAAPRLDKDWPREPIDLVDGVPFLVVHGYTLGGYPEPASEYLEYCVRYCDWSTEGFTPKTAEEKQKALAKLLASPRWKQPISEDAKKALSSQIE